MVPNGALEYNLAQGRPLRVPDLRARVADTLGQSHRLYSTLRLQERRQLAERVCAPRRPIAFGTLPESGVTVPPKSAITREL